MTSRVWFHPLVVSDLRRAIKHYDAISVELGNRFRRMVDAQFDRIESHPEIYARAFDDVRFAAIERFPYLVLFRIRHERIAVLGLFPAQAIPSSGVDGHGNAIAIALRDRQPGW